MSELPHLTVPDLLFNILVSGLVCAATWHAIDIVQELVKTVRAPRN